MKHFHTITRELALASTTLAIGSTLAVSLNISSAQAAILGEITITGKANVARFTEAAPTNDEISFSGAFTTESSSGLFKNLVAESIASINLTSLDTTSAYIANAPDIPFIRFNDGSKFEITNPFEATRGFIGNSLVISTFFDGRFLNSTGEFFRVGLSTITSISNTGSEDNFSLTLTNICCAPTPVPENTSTGAITLLGLASLAFSQKIILRKRNNN